MREGASPNFAAIAKELDDATKKLPWTLEEITKEVLLKSVKCRK